MRLADQDGWQIMANTPIHGPTWVKYRFVDEVPDGVHVEYLYSLDNPHVEKDRLNAVLDGGGARAAARLFGVFKVQEGAVYPELAPHHFIAPTAIPDDATRFKACDPGMRAPTAVVWAALLRRPLKLADGRVIPDRSLIVYREYEVAGGSWTQHADALSHLEGRRHDEEAGRWLQVDDDGEPVGEAIEAAWMDPAAPEARREFGLRDQIFGKASNPVEPGISDVRWWLIGDDHGPRLYFVAPSTPRLRATLEAYHYPEDAEGKPIRKNPVKVDDHLPDALRYLCRGVRKYLALIP